MNSFEGLTVPDSTEPSEQPPLCAYEPPDDEPHAPDQWFIPARLPHTAEVGAGPNTRVMLSGWHVWRRSVTIRLEVFRRRIVHSTNSQDIGRSPAGALRCEMLFADGRRLTTLDQSSTPSPQNGTTPPTLRLEGGGEGGFHEHLVLHLSQLPPEGNLELFVEWLDEDIPEARTTFDATALRAAAEEAVEIWSDTDLPSARREEDSRAS
ncbi:hypothetical protein [Streptomyces zagrosensis]|uniref:Uncharacterized protein n=1 Tax=Streptomyces zagrosensis TaxID=1042984 RepID=A0A7W9Q575_9ACTN|nr:hypothetical protein [Streptomyces zagrosensis]MBB5933859.1 hypothetical protein [Streptomyces zagrosensis]